MKVLAMLCAVVCAIGGSAFAQSVTDTVKIQIDRAIVVNGTELPAGQFTIQLFTPGAGASSAVLVRSESGAHASVMVSRLHQTDLTAVDGATVILDKRGENYVLDQIWISPNIGYQVLQPSR